MVKENEPKENHPADEKNFFNAGNFIKKGVTRCVQHLFIFSLFVFFILVLQQSQMYILRLQFLTQ